MTTTAPLQLLQTFRHKLLGVFSRRADALFELIDALVLTLDPRSPVELSLSPAFRRRFSRVYDALRNGQVEPERARQLLVEAEPSEALTIAGCAVYGVDTTVDLRPDAETLPDRSKVYSTVAGANVGPGCAPAVGQVSTCPPTAAHGRASTESLADLFPQFGHTRNLGPAAGGVQKAAKPSCNSFRVERTLVEIVKVQRTRLGLSSFGTLNFRGIISPQVEASLPFDQEMSLPA